MNWLDITIATIVIAILGVLGGILSVLFFAKCVSFFL